MLLAVESSHSFHIAVLFFIALFIFCIRVFGLHVCLYTAHVSGAHGGQKRIVNPLELELQMVVSCHMGAGS